MENRNSYERFNRKALKIDAKKDISGRLGTALTPFFFTLAISVILSVVVNIGNYSWFMLVIGNLLSIAYAFLAPSIQVGSARFTLAFIERSNTSFKMLFEDIKHTDRLGNEWLANFLSVLIIVAGFICFIIPGIYLALRLSMINYIFAENPNIKCTAAIKRSMEITKNHIGELIVLALSFILWDLLVIFTFGIAVFYVEPYYRCTFARYYLSLRTIAGYIPLEEYQVKAESSDAGNPFFTPSASVNPYDNPFYSKPTEPKDEYPFDLYSDERTDTRPDTSSKTEKFDFDSATKWDDDDFFS